jgi:glycosyltransferase involved in cell wall biosynthesis
MPGDLKDSAFTNGPLVSVVMAAWNEEKYIGEAIESVLAQSYTNFEFIIVNDGSTDRTREIILSYADRRIIYLENEQNLKLIASLNKGLKAAQGKYIARMDADDICLVNRLEKQVAFMEANPGVGISGAQLNVFGNESGMMSYPLNHKDIALRLFITSCFGNNVVIFRKDLLEEYNLYFPQGYFHAEDYKCWTNWIRYTRLANLNEALVKYRSHASSVSVKNKIVQRETRGRVRTEYVTEIFKLEDNKTIASDFTGNLSLKRIRASRFILDRNKALGLFTEEEMQKVVYDLWYSDALENAESHFFAIFKYPYIFKLAVGGNLKQWINVLKHYIKTRLTKTN